MSDADLTRTEGNKPVALDVVDGNLVVERYDGSEESFALGGGGSGILARGYSQLTFVEASAKAAKTAGYTGSGDSLDLTDAWYYADQFGQDPTPIEITQSDLEAETNTYVPFGPDLYLYKGNPGTDQPTFVYFKNPGLYIVGYTIGPVEAWAGATGKMGLLVTHGGSVGVVEDGVADIPRNLQGSFICKITPGEELADVANLSGWETGFTPTVWQTSGVAKTMYASLNIQRLV